MTKSKKSAAAKPKYQPTAAELSAVEKFAARRAASPRMRATKRTNAPTKLEARPHGPDGRLRVTRGGVGTADIDFLDGFLNQLVNASAPGREVDERELGFMLSLVKSVRPRDEVEAMLAAQMAAVHMATMTFARRLAHVENIPQQDSAEARFNKLARTFARKWRH